jgi:protoheme ferro-lyase
MNNYDALLIVSFGGPEGMEDVIPFLENVLRGRNVPRERMLQVARHYEMFGGVSPINDQNRKLINALQIELDANGPKLPIYWGNRNWHPLLPDTLQQMTGDGIKHALAFVTSAYSSYSSCRQYRQNSYAPSIITHSSLKRMLIVFVKRRQDSVRAPLRKLSSPLTVCPNQWPRIAITFIS